jgi:hypothetical protein
MGIRRLQFLYLAAGAAAHTPSPNAGSKKGTPNTAARAALRRIDLRASPAQASDEPAEARDGDRHQNARRCPDPRSHAHGAVSRESRWATIASRCLTIAGLSGFLTLSQSREGLDR